MKKWGVRVDCKLLLFDFQVTMMENEPDMCYRGCLKCEAIRIKKRRDRIVAY